MSAVEQQVQFHSVYHQVLYAKQLLQAQTYAQQTMWSWIHNPDKNNTHTETILLCTHEGHKVLQWVCLPICVSQKPYSQASWNFSAGCLWPWFLLFTWNFGGIYQVFTFWELTSELKNIMVFTLKHRIFTHYWVYLLIYFDLNDVIYVKIV